MTTETGQADLQQGDQAKKPGPKTPEAFAAIALNAFKHGYTSRIGLVPDSQKEAFEKFSAPLREDYAPVGAREIVAFQKIAVYEWRIVCANLEADNLQAIRTMETSKEIAGDDVSREVISSAIAFDQILPRLDLLGRYENRIHRWLKEVKAELRELQIERRNRIARDLTEAPKTVKQLKAKGLPIDLTKLGFVCSQEDIDLYNYRKEMHKVVVDAEYDERYPQNQR